MKVHPQIISQNEVPAFIVLPYKEYQSIIEILDDILDIEAINEFRLDKHERFLLELVESLANKENPIKVFREYRGVSQIQLAKKVAVSRQYISQIENGERVGTAKVLKMIAKTLTVELDDIT